MKRKPGYDLGQGHDYQADDGVGEGAFSAGDALLFAAAGDVAETGKNDHYNCNYAHYNRQQIDAVVNRVVQAAAGIRAYRHTGTTTGSAIDCFLGVGRIALRTSWSNGDKA